MGRLAWRRSMAGSDRYGVPVRALAVRRPDGLDEVGPDGWVSRQVEVAPDGRYLAAAALSEVLAARDTGDVSAVTTYEQVYGIVPEPELGPDAEPYLIPVSGREFNERWM